MPGVEPGLAGGDPLGHEAAHAAGAGDAVGAEAGCYAEAADGRLAEDELAVGREGLRAVHELHDLGLGERRHAPGGVLEKGAKRSQSSSRSLLLKSAGMPPRPHGAGLRS